MVKPLFEIINWIIDYGRIKRLVNTKINQSESSINTFTHLSIIDIIKLLGCNDYKHFSKYMISFNNIKYPQYARPTNNFSSTQQQTQHNNPKKTQLYALSQTIPITANSIIYSPQKQQKIINSSKNSLTDMAELSQDLNKLKEQLKRLSNHQQEQLSSQNSRESFLLKQGERPKSNLSSDAHINIRKEFSYTELAYPNKPIQSNRNEISKTITQPKLISNNSSQRVVPIINPNKRQSERISSVSNTNDSRIIQNTLSGNQDEIINLKQPVANLLKELEVCKTENEAVKKDLLQAKDKLKAKELQEIHLTSRIDTQKEQFQKHLLLERNQHLQIVQNLYQQIEAAKKVIIEPGKQFDTALKTQIQANEELKKQLLEQEEQIITLKDQIQDQNNIIQNFKKQLQIQQLKVSSEYRARIQRLQINLAQKDIEIHNSKRNLQTLDFRYRASLRQLQQKDGFIMNYFLHRSSDGQKSEVSEFFRTYKSQFAIPATLQLFLKQQKQVQQLKKKVQAR